MNILEAMYFLVSGSKAYKEDGLGFHTFFFDNGNGFLFGFLLALAIAVLVAMIFYLGFCMKKETFSAAKTTNWVVGLILVGVLSFFANDLLLVGTPVTNANTQSVNGGVTTYYKSNESFVKVKKYDQQYVDAKNKLNKQIQKWGDVRIQYDLNTALWCMIIYVGVSLCIKGFTPFGNCIPCKWPTK